MGSILIVNEKDGKKYKLQYNRASIVRMERDGFNIEKIKTEPISTITCLYRGAFYMNNPSLTDDEIDAIVDDIDCGEEFTKALVELYGEALNSIVGTSKQTKNFKWERN